MKLWKRMPLRMRLLLSVVMAAAALLLLGAARVQDGMRNHVSDRQQTHRLCRTLTDQWLNAMPSPDRAAWCELAESEPETLFRAACPVLTVMKRNP